MNLGLNDALERVVHRLGEISNRKSCEKKDVVLEYVKTCKEKEWNRYFPILCKNEYLSYELMWEYPEVYKAFEKCVKEQWKKRISVDECDIQIGIEKFGS